jgi:hypothetical protein
MHDWTSQEAQTLTHILRVVVIRQYCDDRVENHDFSNKKIKKRPSKK